MGVPADWMLCIAAAVALLGLVGGGEVLRSLGVSAASTRQIVHGGVAGGVALLPLGFQEPTFVYVLAVGFVGINAAAKWNGWWTEIHEAQSGSWGTVTMPLALLLALPATWSVTPDRIPILQAAFLVLALADPLAARIGTVHGRREWVRGASLRGSGVFFAVTVGVLFAFLVWLGVMGPASALMTALAVAGGTTAAEAISPRGSDNLTVVLSVVLIVVPVLEGHTTPGLLLTAGGVGGTVGGLAYAVEALTGRGAVAASLLAATLVGVGGAVWAVPGFAFFVGASALSFLPAADVVSEAPRRTVRQVLANGGVAWGLLFVAVLAPTPAPLIDRLCVHGFLGALAAAAADTWATELGTRYAGSPWSLRHWTRVSAGTSGAVSVVGTVGAALGAASVAGAALLVDAVGGASTADALLIVGSGLVGMAADSLAGATVQGRDEVKERELPASESGSTVRPGLPWIDNDVVNLVCTSAGAVAAILLSWTL